MSTNGSHPKQHLLINRRVADALSHTNTLPVASISTADFHLVSEFDVQQPYDEVTDAAFDVVAKGGGKSQKNTQARRGKGILAQERAKVCADSTADIDNTWVLLSPMKK